MTYDSPIALRTALETRLLNESRDKSIDYQRLRRRAVFERLLVRLIVGSPGKWVLKGGMALEVRVRERARATRDLDLAVLDSARDGEELREHAIELLAEDPDGDRFTFEVGMPSALDADAAGRPGWRFPVRAFLAGKLFEAVRLDIVARDAERTATESIALPGVLAFAGVPTRAVEVITRTRHFAEKLHALTREYGNRENSRVRDLPDLILLIEDGLGDLGELRRVTRMVFEERATHEMPIAIPDPPSSWQRVYPELAASLDIEPKTLDEAMKALREFWDEVSNV